MNRVINRWLIVTGIFALIFAGLTWYFRDSEGNISFYEGRNSVRICEYIEINMLKTDVELIPYTRDEIRVEYKSLMPISVMLGENRLVIEESDEFVLSFMTGSTEQFGLRVYLPKDIYKEITVYTSSGNVEVGRIDSEDITVVSKSGAISATETRSLVNLVSGTGDIILDFESVIAGSSIETRQGDALISFPAESSVALSYETETGEFSSDLLSGSVEGSYMYSFSGGNNLIHANIGSGTLTVEEHR